MTTNSSASARVRALAQNPTQATGLLFGLVSLEQYAAAHETLVPRLLTQAIAEIDARGLDAEGIYVRLRRPSLV